MPELDRVIHEPARLRILMVLSGVDEADFNFLLSTLGLSRGNLSAHMDKLEQAGYVAIEKGFNGKIPHTVYRCTMAGREALAEYWRQLDAIRGLSAQP
ncbi:transcriptional regulator [bacterium]|nr:transcriptional regulator [bacterium]